MKKDIRFTKKYVRKYAITLIVAFSIYLIGAIVTSMLINFETIKDEWMGYGVALSLLLGSAVSGCVVSAICEEKILLNSGINAVLTVILIIVIGAISRSISVGKILVTLLIVFGGNLAAAIICTGLNGRILGRTYRVRNG